MKTYRFIAGLFLLSIAGAASGVGMRPSVAQDMPPEVLAVQIRSQGFACEKPLSAARDKGVSRPDQAVWILKCQNVTYRVQLNPGMAARVQRLN
jgi:hypothetical protein